MHAALWIIGIYLGIGIGLTIYSYEPENDGLVWQILLWPLTVAAIFLK